VAAHDIVRRQGLQTNLLIAGNPDPANPASVSMQEVNEWTERPGVTWLGHIKDISSLWRRCHFAILPSHREGLPGSLMEAAACGRAMIATDAPGCREIVIDDQTGLLVGIEDPQALARAIAKLATSPELRARYGKAARELVVSTLSARIIGEQIVRLYNDIIAARTSRTPSA
jgi:glycosyltransferase involved in cell wall biosynthesis